MWLLMLHIGFSNVFSCPSMHIHHPETNIRFLHIELSTKPTRTTHRHTHTYIYICIHTGISISHIINTFIMSHFNRLVGISFHHATFLAQCLGTHCIGTYFLVFSSHGQPLDSGRFQRGTYPHEPVTCQEARLSSVPELDQHI